MKNKILLAILAITLIFGFISCPNNPPPLPYLLDGSGNTDANGEDGGELPTLSGNITITPANPNKGQQLTANYSGKETVSYQWTFNGSDVSASPPNKYTPTEGGSCSVTVSAAGYQSKTASVDVNDPDLLTLSGNITISPGSATVGTELTATYSGSETVTYQWRKDGENIAGATTNKYTPIAAGSYTVTVTASGYNGKTSAAVVVSAVTVTPTGATIYAIAFANGRFVAAGGSGRMAYSSDGVTWTGIPGGTGAGTSTFGTTSDIYAITYDNGKFVAGGGSGKMATSPDGINWTAVGNSTF